MMEAGLVALLQADAGLSALIGARVYPVLLPPNQGVAVQTLPALTYKLITGGHSEPTFDTSGMLELRMEFDALGVNFADCSQVRDALMKVLNGFRGRLPDGSWLEDVQFIQARDVYVDKLLLYDCVAEFYLIFTMPRA